MSISTERRASINARVNIALDRGSNHISINLHGTDDELRDTVDASLTDLDVVAPASAGKFWHDGRRLGSWTGESGVRWRALAPETAGELMERIAAERTGNDDDEDSIEHARRLVG